MAEEYGLTSEARERRRRVVITILLVALAVFFAVWYAMSYVRADTAQETREPSSTSTSTSCALTPGQVEVNVYNATGREGLAGQVAAQLEGRGFDVQAVANDPRQVEVAGVGQLRHGPEAAKGAELVAGHVGDLAQQPDERQRSGVDVVLGPDFDGLVAAGTAESC